MRTVLFQAKQNKNFHSQFNKNVEKFCDVKINTVMSV